MGGHDLQPFLVSSLVSMLRDLASHSLEIKHLTDSRDPSTSYSEMGYYLAK